MTKSVLDKLNMSSVKSLMDIILLSKAKSEAITGYDAISYLHENYGVMISAGTVYAHLYALERDGLISSKVDSKSRIFKITENGEKIFEDAKAKTIEVLKIFRDLEK